MSTAKKTAAAKAAEQIEAAVAAGKESVETVVKAGNEAAARNYEKALAVTREQIDAAFGAGAETFKAVKGYEEFAAFSKDNVEAAVASGTVFARSLQDFSKAWFGLAQASVDDSVAATKKILGCKNFQDVVEAQTALAADRYGKLVAVGHELSDISVKLAGDTLQPIAGRFAAAVEKFAKPHSA